MTAAAAGRSDIHDSRAWAELLVFGLLVLLLGARAASRQWLGDFWEHAAVVHELATRPLAPRHPLLDLDVPHAFASPYALGVALVSRLTGLGPIATLEIAGVFNLVVLLISLRAFVRTLSPWPAAPLLTLFFTLFLWGREAWRYSGFFHIASIGHVLPYPSTLAAGVSLLLLAACAQPVAETGRGNLRRSLLTATGASFVLLVHPLTFVMLACGLAALEPRRREGMAGVARLALTLGGAVLLAAPWPYFPVLKLLLHEAAAFHPGNDVLYHDPLLRIWPALLGLPPLARRLSRDPRDPVALLFIALGVVYGFGAATGAWSYGRTVAFAVLMLHVALADALAAALDATRPALRRALPALCGAAFLVAAWLHPSFAAVWREAREGRLRHDPWLEFLQQHVGADEVVLTPPDYSWYVPVFAGKLVGYPHRLAFVPDQAERNRDVERYFSESTSAEARREIRARRNVAAVLLPKLWLADWTRHAEELSADGALTIYDAPEHLLLRSRQSRTISGTP